MIYNRKSFIQELEVALNFVVDENYIYESITPFDDGDDSVWAYKGNLDEDTPCDITLYQTYIDGKLDQTWFFSHVSSKSSLQDVIQRAIESWEAKARQNDWLGKRYRQASSEYTKRLGL